MSFLAISGLRFAVLGICHWHAEYYRDILAAENLNLVGAWDSNTDKGSQKASSWNLKFFQNPEDMVERSRPDFLFVLPRHDRAVVEISRAASFGLPLLMEKPMGLNAEETASAVKSAEMAGIFADVCLPTRHAEIWSELHDYHGDTAAQNLVYAHFRTINGPPSRYTHYGVPWMLSAAISGGGSLRNLGFHGADAAVALGGGAIPEVISASVQRTGLDAIEHYASAMLRLKGGATITLESGYALPSDTAADSEWRVCTNQVHACQTARDITIHRHGESKTTVARSPADQYRTMVNESVRAFVEGNGPKAPLSQAVSAAALIDEIYRVADQK